MSVADRVGLDDFNDIPDPARAEIVEHPGRYMNTDMGNADRFADRFGDVVRYCPPWSKWLVWDGRRWAVDELVRVEQYADATVRGIIDSARRLPEGTDGRVDLLKHGVASQKASRIRAVLELGRARDGIPVKPDQLDVAHRRLNVLNGTLDLNTFAGSGFELLAHNKADLCTKLAPVEYDPDARCERWRKFLVEVFDGDGDLIEYVQRAVGYSLTGDTSAQVFFLLWGSGENGKTKFLETLRALLGDHNIGGYAQQAPPETFIERRGQQGIPNDVARLKGARFVTAVETAENRRLDEALVKRITGGDHITARFLRAEFFEFEPHFKVWLATNHRPTIKGTDHAIWRRIRLLPFNVSFAETKDPDLGDKLKAELPGILNWALSGWREFLLGSQLEDPPAAVVAATAEYRQEEDVFGRFLDEKCTLDQTQRVKSSDLYDAYVAWCHGSGERAETKNKIGRELTARGLDSISSNGVSWRLGVDLVTPAEELPGL